MILLSILNPIKIIEVMKIEGRHNVVSFLDEFATQYNGDWRPTCTNKKYYLVYGYNSYSAGVQTHGISAIETYFKDSGFVEELVKKLNEDVEVNNEPMQEHIDKAWQR